MKKYHPLPPHTWERQSTSMGEANKSLVITIITIIALVVLSLFLLFGKEMFVGKAIEFGVAEEGEAGIFLTDNTLPVDGPTCDADGCNATLPVTANIGDGSTVALGFELTLPDRATCTSVTNLLDLGQGEAVVLEDIGDLDDVGIVAFKAECENGKAVYEIGTIDPDANVTGEFNISNVTFSYNPVAFVENNADFTFDSFEIIDLERPHDNLVDTIGHITLELEEEVGLVCPDGETSCNDVCVDLTTDSDNCNQCGRICGPYDNANANCQAGVCGIASCGAGWVNADENVANGCECTPTNGGDEICGNDIDEDCDGEDFACPGICAEANRGWFPDETACKARADELYPNRAVLEETLENSTCIAVYKGIPIVEYRYDKDDLADGSSYMFVRTIPNDPITGVEEEDDDKLHTSYAWSDKCAVYIADNADDWTDSEDGRAALLKLPNTFAAVKGCIDTLDDGKTFHSYSVEEVCDGLDNDCDGQRDEDLEDCLICDEGLTKCSGVCVDLTIDKLNCGACENVCGPFAHATANCQNSICGFANCLEGWSDADGVVDNGCELECEPTNDGAETCDGIDNNCNGQIDEAVVCAGNKICSAGKCIGALSITQTADVTFTPLVLDNKTFSTEITSKNTFNTPITIYSLLYNDAKKVLAIKKDTLTKLNNGEKHIISVNYSNPTLVENRRVVIYDKLPHDNPSLNANITIKHG